MMANMDGCWYQYDEETSEGHHEQPVKGMFQTKTIQSQGDLMSKKDDNITILVPEAGTPGRDK